MVLEVHIVDGDGAAQVGGRRAVDAHLDELPGSHVGQGAFCVQPQQHRTAEVLLPNEFKVCYLLHITIIVTIVIASEAKQSSVKTLYKTMILDCFVVPPRNDG